MPSNGATCSTFHQSAGDILDRYFETSIVKALFGFDGVVGNYASPYTRVRPTFLLHHLFGERQACPARGHAIGGMGRDPQAMAGACREKRGGRSSSTHRSRRSSSTGTGGRGAWRRQGVFAQGQSSRREPKLLFDRLLPDGSVAPDISGRMSGGPPSPQPSG
jgi:phytoene dehydrogenase-like protein